MSSLASRLSVALHSLVQAGAEPTELVLEPQDYRTLEASFLLVPYDLRPISDYFMGIPIRKSEEKELSHVSGRRPDGTKVVIVVKRED